MSGRDLPKCRACGLAFRGWGRYCPGCAAALPVTDGGNNQHAGRDHHRHGNQEESRPWTRQTMQAERPPARGLLW